VIIAAEDVLETPASDGRGVDHIRVVPESNLTERFFATSGKANAEVSMTYGRLPELNATMPTRECQL
jgi:hypothetical protein